MNFSMLDASLLMLFLLSCASQLLGEEDLYGVLGVSKTASLQEIKRAYKNLAKEWHPDKNKHPQANDKFMKINEAYETLSDQGKRSQYDRYGTSSADNAGASSYGHGDSFGEGTTFTFNGVPFNFNFQRPGSVNSKNRITLRLYENNILPESHTKPYLVYIYTTFCFQCNMVAPVWEQLEQDLDKIGMGIGVFDAQLDPSLSRKLRVSNLPAVVAINCGRPQWFSGKQFTRDNLREFVRSQYPVELIVEVNSDNIKEFLGGWKDNKVRMLLFDTRKQPCLRYVAAAFTFRERVLAGYVNVARLNDEELLRRYHVTRSQENLLVFHEDEHSPVASIAMPSISRNTMDEVIDAHKYLTLPRLSSQSMFNYLCPVSSNVRDKMLCVLLLSRNIPQHEEYRNSYRDFVLQNTDKWSRVKFAYVYEDTQSPFVKSVTWGRGVVNDTLGTLKVVVVWRKDQMKIQFDSLDDGWFASGDELKQSERNLVQLINWRLESNDRLTFAIELPQEFIDEHAKPLFRRIIRRLGDWLDLGLDRILSIDESTFITVCTTACAIVVIAFMMRVMFKNEQERVATVTRPRSNIRPQANSDNSTQGERPRPVVNLVPLCAVNYNELIVNGATGVRLIVLLVDEPSKTRLLQQYASIILPYCRADNLKFSFLQLEQYIEWYRSLLESTSEFHRSIDRINIKNCIGTVLAISGPHNCYWMYHASSDRVSKAGSGHKVYGSSSGSSRGLRNRRSGGEFLGMQDSSDSDDGSRDNVTDADILFESDLLQGLYMWLDRLCEGTLQRFRVHEWPDMVAQESRSDASS